MARSRKKPVSRLILVTVFLAFLTLFLFSVSGGSLRASIFDGAGLVGGLQEAEGELSGSGIRTDNNIVLVIVAIINAILPYAALAALVAFVVAGFFFILGFGSDTAIQRAKKIMIWSAVGLVVILFALIITRFILELATA
jgi:hypothetical protein